VMVVDHEAMRVAHLLVAVPGRAVVGPDELRCVKVVITRPVRMLHFVVLVFEFFGIFAWPERHRGDHTKYGKDRQDEISRAHPQTRAKPTGGGISGQPADMRQSELGREQGRPVLGM